MTTLHRPPRPPRTTLLTDRFRALGLDRTSIRRMTERGDDLRSPLTPTRAAMFNDDPAAIVLRLFFCRVPVERSEAEHALGTELLNETVDCGVLVEESHALICPFHVRPVCNLYLFSDFLGDERDSVMGAGETTAILYKAAHPEHTISKALDLGCGAGTLALLLASAVERVIGTDINPRAVEFSKLNAALNGIGNVEFRAGDLYTPVAGERFDLIVSQPPYYPNRELNTTGEGLTFLHGGERGDELAHAVMAGVPRHLSPRGRALVFASWAETSPLAELAGYDVLELHTGRREVNGARQSIRVVKPGAGWSARFEVSAECWGSVQPKRVEEIFAAMNLLRAPGRNLLSAALRLPPGSVPFQEGSRTLIRYPAESLLGLAPVDHATWDVMSRVIASPDVAAAGLDERALETLKQALDRGLLTLEL